MASLNLDDLIAEANQEPRELIVGGKTYELPAVFPIMVIAYLQKEQIHEALSLLVGEDNLDSLAPHIGFDHIEAIMTDVYNLDRSVDKDAVEAKAHEKATGKKSGKALSAA